MSVNVSIFPSRQQAEGSPSKRKFTPSSSTRMPFSRTDSRGECQLEAAPPEEVQMKLQSIGMRARMAVNRGYDPCLPLANISSTNTNNASLEGSSRSVWSRVQSAPSYTKDLQPFSHVAIPSHSFASGLSGAAQPIQEEEDGMSIASGSYKSGASKKRGMNAEDVLGDFMGSDDDDNDNDNDSDEENISLTRDGEDMAMTTDDRPSNPFRPIKTLPTPSSIASNPFPRRTFTQSHTLPAASTTSRYLSSAGVSSPTSQMAAEDPEEEAKWKAIRFEEFVKQDDF